MKKTLLVIAVLAALVGIGPAGVRAQVRAPEPQAGIDVSPQQTVELVRPVDGALIRITWNGTASRSWNETTPTRYGDDRYEGSTSVGFSGLAIIRYSAAEDKWRTVSVSASISDQLQSTAIHHCVDAVETVVSNRALVDLGPWDNPEEIDFSVTVYRRIADGSYFLYTSGVPVPDVTYQWNSKTVRCDGSSFSESESWLHHLYIVAAPPDATNGPIEGDETGTKFTVQYSNVQYSQNFSLTITRLPSSAAVEQATELAESSTFLPSIPLVNRLDTELTCKGDSQCEATRELRNQGTLVQSEQLGPVAGSGTFPKDLDIGTLPPGPTLVTAQGRADGESAPDTKQIQVAERLPAWAKAIAIIAQKVGGTAVYSGELIYPDPPASGKVRIPGSLPLPFGLAGNEIGLDDTQAKVKLEVSATGEGELEGGGKTGFVVAGDVVGGELTFRMNLALDAQGLRASDGAFKLKIYGKIDKKEPLVKVIPATNAILTPLARISPAAAVYVASLADLELGIEPSVTFELKLTEDGFGEITFERGDVEPGFGIRATLSIQPKDFLKILGGVGGEIASRFEAPPFQLKQISAKLQAFAEIVVYRWVFNPTAAYSWSYPGGAAGLTANAEAAAASSGTPLWQPADRSYLDRPDYARWTAPSLAPSALGTQATDSELAANVYPQAQPALAVAGRRFLVWSHDRADAPAESGGEIAAATSPGFGRDWMPTAPATNDDRDDYSRQVVILPGTGGDAVAVWERFDTATPGDPNSDPNAYLSHVQVAAARWDSTTGTWDTPVQLSTSGFLNNRPHLGATSTGALAIWIGNEGNQIVGDAKPDTIYFARYTASTGTWTAPAALPGSPLEGLLEISLATAGSRAALVYTQDLDGKFETETDQELFSLLWDGTAWGAPVRLTTNSVVDDRPRIVLVTTTGAPRLVWRQNGGLKFLDGSWDTGAAIDLPIEGAARGADLRLVQAPDRTLALTWQQPTARETRVGYAVYDTLNSLWGTARTLEPPVSGTITGTTSLATNITSALETGRLLIAYQSATVEPVTATVDGVTVPNVPQVGAHSLRYAEVSLGRNLTIEPSDISTSPAPIAPGDTVTVSAAIHNTGELAVPSVRVDLLQSIEPAVVVSQTVGPLRAGETVTTTFTIPQPALRDRAFTVAVDPDRRVVEVAEEDNRAAVLPSLSLTPLASEHTGQTVHVHAQVAQTGGLHTSEMLTVSLRLNSPSGPELATTLLALPITPTESLVTASGVITAGQLGPGRHHVHWVPDSAKPDADPDMATNGTASTANILPDLTTDAESISFRGDPAAAAPLSLWVFNRGNWSSSGGRVAVYDRDPAEAGSQQLTSLSLPEIAAGGLVTLTGTLPAGVPSLYLQIDPDRATDEVNENNNLLRAGSLSAGAGAVRYRLHLPIIQRQAGGW